MTANTWMIEQIEVQMRGAFTTHHEFRSETEHLGEITLPAFSQQGTFQTASGRELLMRKTSWLSRSQELLEGEEVRATAAPRGLFSRDFVVHYEGAEYTLQPEGILKRGWFLIDAEGNTLLEIQPRGIFRQGAFLYPRSVMDLDLVAFVYYLVHVRQQEEAAAAAAS